MKTVTSKDGTQLAYEQLGSGPPVVLVDGAFCGLSFGPSLKLAPLLAKQFTVFYYDRRGRGASKNSTPYSVDKEVEDLHAIFQAAGGAAHLYGTSSGAALAIRGAASGLNVKKLALHEPPFALDGTHQPSPPDFREQIQTMVTTGKESDAVKLFMSVVGVPKFGIAFMRLIPGVWSSLRAAAPTLPYDYAVLGDTQSGGPLPSEFTSLLASIKVPTLALVGGKSPPWMHHSVKTVAGHVSSASVRVLPGQQHNVSHSSVGPVLVDFFAA